MRLIVKNSGLKSMLYPKILSSVMIFLILFLLIGFSGCLSSVPSSENLTRSGNFTNDKIKSLTSDEIAYQFLESADKIIDYSTKYRMWVGDEDNPSIKTNIKLDYKSPKFIRVELFESENIPGTIWITNGTSAMQYDMQSRTYQPYFGSELISSNDYQFLARKAVEDRHFTIIQKEASNGTERYLIESSTGPWAANFTPYEYSYVRIWIQPSTGLAWSITLSNDSLIMPTSIPQPKTPPIYPNVEVRYESIALNTGIPESYFDFIPPNGSTLLPSPYWK
jgi:outer membrane lipoprotein-sorting protein